MMYSQAEFKKLFLDVFAKELGTIAIFDEDAELYNTDNLPYFASGYCTPSCFTGFEKPLVVLQFEEFEQQQMLSVLIHEHAHALLHDDPLSELLYEEMEIEAETVALKVMDYLGYSTETNEAYIQDYMEELVCNEHFDDGYYDYEERSKEVDWAIMKITKTVDKIPYAKFVSNEMVDAREIV